MSWSHLNLKFVFSGLSDLVPYFDSKAMRVENAASTPPFPTPPHCCPSACLTLPCFYYWFGKAHDLPVQLPRWPLMVYFMSKCILVPLCSNFQDKFSSHELTCLQCGAAIVCHTFQIKGSQDGQCLQDAGSCRGLRLAALSTGMVFGGYFAPHLPNAAEWCLSGGFTVTSGIIHYNVLNNGFWASTDLCWFPQQLCCE